MNSLAPGEFLSMFEDFLGFPPFPLLFRKDYIEVKCSGCGEILVVKVPEPYVRTSYKYCSNCGSLIKITWIDTVLEENVARAL